MKEINGTVTLAYVEEDNRRRVIFRVVPLCTREGVVFQGTAEEFPDEGSLRIVPDKREQSTFKERMREIGGLCAVQLLSEGKELMKVRQNRNYAPDQEEKNQFAIYSDVICEFAEDGCLEVVEPGTDASGALTARVLIGKDKMLYGPVAKEEAQNVSLDGLKPFGNDHFLLHAIDSSIVGKHLIYWNPEALLNWRQRRNSLRRRERAGQESAAPKTAEAKEIPEETQVQEKEQPARPRRMEKQREAAAPKPEEQQAPVEEREAPQIQGKPDADADAALPIGTRLEILDAELPFEQQISQLAQPLSEGANRLTNDVPAPEDEPVEAIAHFSGTPLVPTNTKMVKSCSKPENVHHVVEKQMRRQRDEVMGEELGSSTYGLVENPIENLQECLDYIWQNPEIRDQALQALLQNPVFTADMTNALRRNGANMQTLAAAQEQLVEIEADRLSLLMQLENAKENEKKFRDEALASLSQRRRDEVERLQAEILRLKKTCNSLQETTQVLSSGNASQVTAFMAEHMTCMTGAGDDRLLLSPVLGTRYSQQELAEKLRVHMNESGFSINEDDAMCLLISFSLFDGLCLQARTLADAQLFAAVLLESFGLQSVSATLRPGAYVEMVSLLPETENRTPTVTVQPVGTETISVFGHKTLFLAAGNMTPEAESLLPYPVIPVPAMTKRAFGRIAKWEPVAPAALSTFIAIRADLHPMLQEADNWFSALKQTAAQCGLSLPDVMFVCMRRFIEVASRKVRGGFLAAADMAVCHWIAPVLLCNRQLIPQMTGVLSGLPHALELLGIR